VYAEHLTVPPPHFWCGISWPITSHHQEILSLSL